MKAIEFYSGVGGFSLGLKRAGFHVEAAFEIDWRHVETYNKNFNKGVAIKEDVATIDFDTYDYNLNLSDLDLVFGGPPCQGFSNGGKQNSNDLRNIQVVNFANLIIQLSPRGFIMENVSGILNKKFKQTLDEFYRLLSSNGYYVHKPLILNASDYYVPQNRKRVFFVGFKKNISQFLVQPFVRSKFKSDNRVTVEDALCDIMHVNLEPNSTDIFKGSRKKHSSYSKILADASFDNDIREKSLTGIPLTGLMTTFHSSKVIERFTVTPPGKSEPISRYKKLLLSGLSPTLRAGTTRGMGQFMAPRPIHPIFPRCITTREAARLHSFPDWFTFYPTKWYGMMQIGNSVPPHLAESIGHSIFKALS